MFYVILGHRIAQTTANGGGSSASPMGGIDRLGVAMLVAAIVATPFGIIPAAPAFVHPVWLAWGIGPRPYPITFEVVQRSGYHDAMSITKVPFSQLVQHPKDTMAKLEESPRRRIKLNRRDGEDLILESASRAQAEDDALDMAGRLFFSLVKSDAGARALLLSLPDVFPWVKFLPTEDVRAFLVELVETIRACADLGNMAAIAPVVAAWQGTAEIYSDPELHKAALAPLDGTDYGDVPED
jgi:hypothetical protein